MDQRRLTFIGYWLYTQFFAWAVRSVPEHKAKLAAGSGLSAFVRRALRGLPTHYGPFAAAATTVVEHVRLEATVEGVEFQEDLVPEFPVPTDDTARDICMAAGMLFAAASDLQWDDKTIEAACVGAIYWDWTRSQWAAPMEHSEYTPILVEALDQWAQRFACATREQTPGEVAASFYATYEFAATERWLAQLPKVEGGESHGTREPDHDHSDSVTD